MKKQILTFSDSNMAGDTWRWYFFLDGETGGAYSLSCEQILNGDAGSPIEPVTGLRRGADVWIALNTMMSDAGYSLAEFDLSEIAAEIAKLNVNLANQLKRGERLIERRDKAAAKTDSDCREKILAVNGGAKAGQRGGVKSSQWREGAPTYKGARSGPFVCRRQKLFRS